MISIGYGRMESCGKSRAPAQSKGSTMERPMVVVLEDDPANAWGLSLVLQDWGYRTVTGASIKSVVAQLDAQGAAPVAAICDFHLAEGQDGVSAARVLRERYGREIAVVIVTGSNGSAARHRAEPASIPVLHKPVDPDLLQHYLPAA